MSTKKYIPAVKGWAKIDYRKRMIFLDVHIENLGEGIVFSLALLSVKAGFLLLLERSYSK